jgi:SEC-C motif domain protein
MQKNCPCHSEKPYKECCQPFHTHALRPNALQLMRSRYSAYVLQMIDYLIQTTHPDYPKFTNLALWKSEILFFCQNTQFKGLEILEFIDGDQESYVTFKAILSQKDRDTSFTEKSFFEKIDDRWLYLSGTFL